MTTATSTPFVNTPSGVGVVVVLDLFTGDDLLVRFEDGSRRWVPAADCELDAPRPDWYREPGTAEIAGWVR